MDTGQTPMFNAQRGVSFLPQNKRAKGFKAFKDERRKDEEMAYDEYLTAQERYRRWFEDER